MLFGVLSAEAYDFEKKGILYRITDPKNRTVEVTHWDERTGANGVPDHPRPDPCLAHMHDSTHHHDEHCVVEHVPVIPNFPDTIVIPKKVWYKGRTYTVTAIGDGSFYMRENIQVVRLPKTVTRIGRSAFSGCNNLSSVEWHATLRTIDEYAFYMNNSLDTLVLPDSLKHLDVYAFALCLGLKEVIMPAGLTAFEGNAFLHCSRLKHILLKQQSPPVVKNTGIKMNFGALTFEIQEEALPAYQKDKFWCKQQVQTIQK